MVDRGELAGTVMLIQQGEQIWMDKYGYQNREAEIPMDYGTIFRIASMTKPITSVAAMMLVERGVLQLDDPIETYLPGLGAAKVLREEDAEEALERSITIRDLLLHTAGFSSTMFNQSPAEKAYAEAFRTYRPSDLADFVDKLTGLPLAHQPGEAWTYGFSTDVLARIIEVVSGESIDQFFVREIFEPLGMEDTGFQVPVQKRDRFAVAYGQDGQVVDTTGEESRYCNGQNYARGVGGLVSTASDYMMFCQMLLNGGIYQDTRLLQAETVAQMMQNHLPEGVFPHMPGMPVICNGFGFGFGVQTEEVAMGHPGDCAWPGAYLTYFLLDPTHDGIALLFTQSTDLSKLSMVGEFHSLASELFASNNQGESAEMLDEN